MMFFYVYILQSQSSARERFYVGGTEDLRARRANQNAGEVPPTAKYKSWQIKPPSPSPTKSEPLNLSVTSSPPLAGRLQGNIVDHATPLFGSRHASAQAAVAAGHYLALNNSAVKNGQPFWPVDFETAFTEN